MAELLHIYMNNPTEGGKDGTEVSSGTELAPISVLIDAGKGEQKAVKRIHGRDCIGVCRMEGCYFAAERPRHEYRILGQGTQQCR